MPISLPFKRALKWAYVMSWGEQGSGALITFILASLLGPSEFGTVAIAMIYIMFIQVILDQGLVAALIQRKSLTSEHLDSVFWMALVTSVILVGASLILSGWWAAVNHLPELSLIISVLSISIPIQGFTIVQQALLHRVMDFKSLSIRGLVSVLVGGVVGIGLALRGFGAWALVAQELSRDLVGLSLLWRLSDWRPHWHFSLHSLKDLLGFSTANFIAKLGVFANNQGDALVMGMFFGPFPVGLYRLAERMMGMVMQVTTTSLQIVSFPLFSRAKDNPAELRQSVLSCIRISAIVTILPMVGLAVTSDLLMAGIGEKWADAADALKILCLLGILMSVTQFVGPLLQALARPQYLALLLWVLALMSGCMLVLVGTLLSDASPWEQIVWVAGIRLGTSALIGIPVVAYILPRACRISIKSFLGATGPSFGAGVAAAAVVKALTASNLLQSLDTVLYLVVCIALGGIAGIATLLGLDADLKRDLISSIYRVSRGVGPVSVSGSASQLKGIKRS